jgi:hypothetical protein
MFTIVRRSGLLRTFALTAAGLLIGASSASAAEFTSAAFKSITIKTSEEATTVGESDQFVPVSNASVGNISVAIGDSDLFTVLFTSQVEMQNATSNFSTLNEDALLIRAEAVKNGVVTPFSPSGSVAFASADSVASHALSASARLTRGTYTIRVVGRVRDVTPEGIVSAFLNRWMLTVTRYN